MTRKMSTTIVSVKCAKHRSQRPAPPAADERAAENDGREHLQQKARADQRVAGAGIGGNEQSRLRQRRRPRS